MTTQRSRRHSMEQDNQKLADDLRVAIMTQQLQVFFQPKVCVQSHQVVGAEALLRWQHPTEGLIPADRWVAVAESHNLMRPLTTWLIEHVLGYIKNAGESALPLAINIPPTILDGAFALKITKMLSKATVAAHLLEVEITESTPVLNMTNLANAVRLLKSKGLKVYLDDFGTGYSSMKYLVDIPVDGVKMDKSFVQQAPLIPAARLVLKTLIELAQEIDVHVVCEGVETPEQLELVKELGGQVIQGYLTGKPMTEVAFAKYINAPLPIQPVESTPKRYKVQAS